MTSFPVGNKTSLSQKPCITNKKLLWNTIGKSWSLFQIPSWKFAWSAPSVEITMTSYPACSETSLSRKPCITDKSYYGTLSGSHGRSFRFRHENLPEAHPSVEITMTSYTACNETSLSRKPSILDKKLVWNAIRKSWSLFQNPSWQFAGSAPWRRNLGDVISGLQ